jgi:hypothetical protein
MKLLEPAPRQPEGFWRRQFSDVPTRQQTIFDVIFGIVLPIVCLYFDPIVFRNNLDPCNTTKSFSTQYAFFVYTLIGLGILMLTLWLMARSFIRSQAAVFAGIFFTGSVLSAILGVVLLPLSVIGIILYGLGLLGFIPFLTSLVYLRNSIHAWQSAQEQSRSRNSLIFQALAGVLTIFLIASLVQWQNSALFPQPEIKSIPSYCGSDE